MSYLRNFLLKLKLTSLKARTCRQQPICSLTNAQLIDTETLRQENVKLPDNLLFKNFLLLELSSDFFSRVDGAGSPLPFRICPGEGKVGFGIEEQLRPGLTEELTVAGQVGPTADFSSVPSIFG